MDLLVIDLRLTRTPLRSMIAFEAEGSGGQASPNLF